MSRPKCAAWGGCVGRWPVLHEVKGLVFARGAAGGGELIGCVAEPAAGEVLTYFGIGGILEVLHQDFGAVVHAWDAAGGKQSGRAQPVLA